MIWNESLVIREFYKITEGNNVFSHSEGLDKYIIIIYYCDIYK